MIYVAQELKRIENNFDHDIDDYIAGIDNQGSFDNSYIFTMGALEGVKRLACANDPDHIQEYIMMCDTKMANVTNLYHKVRKENNRKED